MCNSVNETRSIDENRIFFPMISVSALQRPTYVYTTFFCIPKLNHIYTVIETRNSTYTYIATLLLLPGNLILYWHKCVNFTTNTAQCIFVPYKNYKL